MAFDATGTHLWAPTEGAHQVQQLVLSAGGTLSANEPPSVPLAGGPRHIAVHPNGKLAFVIAESGPTLTTFAMGADGALAQVETIPTLPEDYPGQNTGAHVASSPSGVLGGVRGEEGRLEEFFAWRA